MGQALRLGEAEEQLIAARCAVDNALDALAAQLGVGGRKGGGAPRAVYLDCTARSVSPEVSQYRRLAAIVTDLRPAVPGVALRQIVDLLEKQRHQAQRFDLEVVGYVKSRLEIILREYLKRLPVRDASCAAPAPAKAKP